MLTHFNVLDARGAIGVSERSHYIQRVRNLSKQVAISQYKKREELGFPILARRGGINA